MEQRITACAFIHREVEGRPQAFLARRAVSKRLLPGVYELPGGHIEAGEDLIDGLRREIREELHVDVAVGDPFAAFTYVNDTALCHSVEVVFFAQLEDPTAAITLNPFDHIDGVWVGPDELERVYSDSKGPDDPEFVAARRGFALLTTDKTAPR